MNLNLNIKNLDLRQLEELDIKCINCNYWFNAERTNFIEELYRSRNIWDLIKSKIFEKRNESSQGKNIFCFKKSGGRIKAAFDGKKCVGVILSGKYYLFPKLKSFSIYPPDSKSIFLGCLYVIPGYRNVGIEKRLLLDLEKDLIKERIKSIETIGKRLNDDISEYEYEKSPLIPIKFLIKNGFYITKNDELFPLLRLDLKTIIGYFAKSKLLSIREIFLKKKIRSPAIIKKN